MGYLSDSDVGILIEEAKAAAENTYSPYSRFPVGAAVLTNEGIIFRATNVENASYGLTICAERIALGFTVSKGYSNIKAIAVYSEIDSISPCGACRQFIVEFGKDIIVIFKHEQQVLQRTVAELLPFEFTKTAIESHPALSVTI